jgi:hypothetical protein
MKIGKNERKKENILIKFLVEGLTHVSGMCGGRQPRTLEKIIKSYWKIL